MYYNSENVYTDASHIFARSEKQMGDSKFLPVSHRST